MKRFSKIFSLKQARFWLSTGPLFYQSKTPSPLPAMLEAQKNRIYQLSRLKAKGLSEREARLIVQQQLQPFRPAFVNGKRVTERITLDDPATR